VVIRIADGPHFTVQAPPAAKRVRRTPAVQAAAAAQVTAEDAQVTAEQGRALQLIPGPQGVAAMAVEAAAAKAAAAAAAGWLGQET
jgi:hypothetical protein